MWEQNLIFKSKDPRAELRKTFRGRRSSRHKWDTSAEVLIVVRPNQDKVVISTNGSIILNIDEIGEMVGAIIRAKMLIDKA